MKAISILPGDKDMNCFKLNSRKIPVTSAYLLCHTALGGTKVILAGLVRQLRPPELVQMSDRQPGQSALW